MAIGMGGHWSADRSLSLFSPQGRACDLNLSSYADTYNFGLSVDWMMEKGDGYNKQTAGEMTLPVPSPFDLRVSEREVGTVCHAATKSVVAVVIVPRWGHSRPIGFGMGVGKGGIKVKRKQATLYSYQSPY